MQFPLTPNRDTPPATACDPSPKAAHCRLWLGLCGEVIISTTSHRGPAIFRQHQSPPRFDQPVELFREANEELQCGGHGEQFSSVLNSLKEMTAICRLDSSLSIGTGKDNLLCRRPFESIEAESMECLYIGLIPLPTRQCVQELRVKSPASLMRTKKVASDAKNLFSNGQSLRHSLRLRG